MSQHFRQQALDLIEQATQHKHLIVYPTVLVEILDDHHAAALMMQILYWGDRTTDPQGWFYKSYAEWQQELGLSEYQVRRCLDGDPRTKSERLTLRDLGVETKLKKAGNFGSPTMHYRVDRAVFVAVLVEHLEHRHGFQAGQGGEQSQETIPNNVEDRSPTLSSMDTEQCAPASSDSENTNPQTSSKITLIPEPTHHPDEDQDFELFKAFEKQFGKAKTPQRLALKAQLERLGATLVHDILARCVGRGRSWQYVQRALENEAAPSVNEKGVDTQEWLNLPSETDEGVLIATSEIEGTEGALEASERVHDLLGDQSAKAIWTTTIQQLELQLDRRIFDTWVRGAQLVDFDAESTTLVVAVAHRYARDFCQNRLYRTIWRAVEAAAGRAGEKIALAFVTVEERLVLRPEVVAA